MKILSTARRLDKGFTLVELLIVIALIGTLSAILYTFINPVTQFQKSRDTQRKNDLAQLQRALEQYYNDFGNYPINSTDGNYLIKDNSNNAFAWGSPWTPYSNILPKDPTTGQRYIYVSPCPTGGSVPSQSYCIFAHLERGGNDKQTCNQADTDCSKAPSANLCGGKSCNYGVSSSNISP